MTQVAALSSVTCFGAEIRKASFCAAANKSDVTDLDVTLDHMISNVQVSCSPQFIGITGQGFSSSRTCAHFVRLGRLDVEELEAKFYCQHYAFHVLYAR
jgi:hypothetical protein